MDFFLSGVLRCGLDCAFGDVVLAGAAESATESKTEEEAEADTDPRFGLDRLRSGVLRCGLDCTCGGVVLPERAGGTRRCRPTCGGGDGDELDLDDAVAVATTADDMILLCRLSDFPTIDERVASSPSSASLYPSSSSSLSPSSGSSTSVGRGLLVLSDDDDVELRLGLLLMVAPELI